jgi:calcium-dependent protein kinase
MDPDVRLTAAQVMGHTWIKDKAPQASDRPLQASTLNNMKAFKGQNNLKKAALHVIAQRLKEDEIMALKEMFQTLDQNNDGTVTFQELTDGIEKLHVAGLPPNMKELMTEMDVDGSGSIDYTEFLAATLDKKQYEQESICWAAFQVFDSDGSGSISKAELEKVLASGQLEQVMGSQAVERVMKDCDADNDGQIDFNEFMKMMRGSDPE